MLLCYYVFQNKDFVWFVLIAHRFCFDTVIFVRRTSFIQWGVIDNTSENFRSYHLLSYDRWRHLYKSTNWLYKDNNCATTFDLWLRFVWQAGPKLNDYCLSLNIRRNRQTIIEDMMTSKVAARLSLIFLISPSESIHHFEDHFKWLVRL